MTSYIPEALPIQFQVILMTTLKLRAISVLQMKKQKLSRIKLTNLSSYIDNKVRR